MFVSACHRWAAFTIYKIKITSETVVDVSCSCTAGKGTCNHTIAVLYQLSHFQNLGLTVVPPIASKTSAPQQWHIPPRTHGIHPQPISDMTVVKPKVPTQKRKDKKRSTVTGVSSKLYNPVRESLSDASQQFAAEVKQLFSTQSVKPQILQLLPDVWPTTVPSAVGDVPSGSTLSHQQPPVNTDDVIVNVRDAPDRPTCPLPILVETYTSRLTDVNKNFYDGLACTREASEDYERSTRLQSKCPEWMKLRSTRLTASKFKNICSRRKDFRTLAQRIITGKFIQTSAMKRGLDLEPKAAKVYAEAKNMNVYSIGFVINPSATHLGCSPDRLVYDPKAENWGLLEIKCPDKDSYKDCTYLKQVSDGVEFTIKRSHEYYYQIMGQLGITGFSWCDLMVFCRNDYIVERIPFDKTIFDQLDTFYFDYFLPCLTTLK